MGSFTLRNVLSQPCKLSTVALGEGGRVSGWEREDVLQLQQHLLCRVLSAFWTFFFQSQRLHLVCEFGGFLSQLPGDIIHIINSIFTVCDSWRLLMTETASNRRSYFRKLDKCRMVRWRLVTPTEWAWSMAVVTGSCWPVDKARRAERVV